MRLGIDFGTTRTVVAAVDDGRHPLVAFDDAGAFRDYIPGIAALRGDQLLVGWEAARALQDATAGDGAASRHGVRHAIRSIKRAASELLPDELVPGLPGVTALELVTVFLGESPGP
jgi:molecular chaperone DnaK (HSP70)